MQMQSSMGATSFTGAPAAPPMEAPMGALIRKGSKNTVHLVVTGLATKQDAKTLEKALKAVAAAWGGKHSTKRRPKKG